MSGTSAAMEDRHERSESIRDCGHACGSSAKRLRCCTCSLSNPAVANLQHRSQKRFKRRLCTTCHSRHFDKESSAPAAAVRVRAPVRGRAAWVRGLRDDSDSELEEAVAAPRIRASDARPSRAPRTIAPGLARRVTVSPLPDVKLSCLTCESNELFASSDITNAVVCVTCHSVYPEGTFPIVSVNILPRLHPDQEAEIRASMEGFHSREAVSLPSSHVATPPHGEATAPPVVTIPAQAAPCTPSKALEQVAVPVGLTFLSQSLLEELSCTVCLEPFTDPLTLQCGHSVCKSCSIRLLKAYKGPGMDCLSCPICRSITASASKLHVSTELAFVIAVIKSWAIQAATKDPGCGAGVAETTDCEKPIVSASNTTISAMMLMPPRPAPRPIMDISGTHNIGFIVIDSTGALFGVVQGCDAITLHKILRSAAPQRRGGQGQVRFARARLDQRQVYLSKVADLAATYFLRDGVVSVVSGLVLAGPDELKGVLAASPLLDPLLADVVVKVVDTMDGMEDGFQEAISLCKDWLE
jgi:cytochrome c553